MSIEAISGISAGNAYLPLRASSQAPVASGDFMQMVSRGLGEVNTQLLTGQADMQQLAAGNVQSLHQVMIRMEEAKLSFQLLMQVRNRVLESYQDLMRMSV